MGTQAPPMRAPAPAGKESARAARAVMRVSERAHEAATASHAPSCVAAIPVFAPSERARTGSSTLPRIALQRKLAIGAVDDPLEHEADRVAEQVMRVPHREVSIATAPPQISLKCAACEEEEGLQRKAAGPQAAAGEVPGVVREVLGSSGQPLDARIRTDMEPRFGFDFAGVRIHADRDADRAARAINARAYTSGRHIVFAAREYDMQSPNARRLLAHELTHVIQQARSAIPSIQRDTPKETKPTSPPPKKEDAPGRKEALAQVSAIENKWTRVKSISSGFAETKGWISKGDAVIALIREHTARALDAIDAGDTELVNDFKYLVDGDLAAYRYVIWHTFVYQNLARVRSDVDSLVSSFDADRRHFSGRAEAEEAVRKLKGLTDGLGADSAKNLAALITDHPFKIRAGTAREVSTVITSAADNKKRAVLEQETHDIINVQMAAQVILEHTNKFLRNATKEGFWQAVEAVKEYIEVRNKIIDTDGSPDYDDSPKSDEPEMGSGDKKKKKGGDPKKEEPKKEEQKKEEPKKEEPKKDEPKEEQKEADEPKEEKKKKKGGGGKYTCYGWSAVLQIPSALPEHKCPFDGQYKAGPSMSASNEADACLAAKHAFNDMMPRGCRPKHLDCRCSKR
jgi:hypothetical protein